MHLAESSGNFKNSGSVGNSNSATPSPNIDCKKKKDYAALYKQECKSKIYKKYMYVHI